VFVGGIMTKRMKLSVIMILCLMSFFGYTKENIDENSRAVPIGIYISDISDINFKSQTIDIIFWVWSTYEVHQEDFGKTLVVTNAIKTSVIKNTEIKLEDGRYRSLSGIRATLHQHFALERYPLNNQVINISFEDVKYGIKRQHFVPDSVNSYIDANANYLSGWGIGKTYWDVDAKRYAANNSSELPGRKSVTYSRATYHVELAKEPIRSLINTFGITFLTFVLGFCVFLIPRNQLHVRLPLIVASVFAIVGNEIASQSSLPATNVFMLADKVFLFGIVALIINLLLIFLIHFYDQRKAAVILNGVGLVWCAVAVPIIFILLLLGWL
jgi:hypothetical protein